jgi:hypothetical protein
VAKATLLPPFAAEWAVFQAHASQGANAVALVTLDTDEGVIYITWTWAPVRSKDHMLAMKRKLEAPPLSAKVAWVRPFNRRLQRLFGWGHVWASREVVKRAAEEGDGATLLKLMPEQRLAIKLGDYTRVLVAYEVSSATGGAPGPLALGPSSSVGLALADVEEAGASDYSDDEMSKEERQKVRLRLEHDAAGTHCYGDFSMKWECARCDRFPAARCETCDAQRCAKCSHDGAAATPVPQPPHKVMWKQNALDPAPFFVQNPVKLSLEQQVKWLLDELHADATLDEFAHVYRQLLAEYTKGDVQRRLHCLELYGLFNPVFKARKECELLPAEPESFQRVFDPGAPARCRWCLKAMKPGGAYEAYCSDKCHCSDHPPSKCSRCGSDDILMIPQARTKADLGRWPPPKEAFAKCKKCGRTWETDAVTMAYDPRAMPAVPAAPAYKNRKRS